jgi:acetyl esterase/lipase
VSFESRLDPDLRANYAAMVASSRPLDLATIAKLRRAMRALIDRTPAPAPHADVVREDRTVPGPAGEPDITVRIYRPRQATDPIPGVCWIHGGGMVVGWIDEDDQLCEHMVLTVGCVVVSVEYRLAPEHPHPAPVEDCYAGLVWTADHAAELGIDPTRLAIAGASAGGGLAAGVALLARDRARPALAFQSLMYPMLDDRATTSSSREFSGIGGWNAESNTAGWQALLGESAGGADVSPYAAPARAADLSGLPPTHIQVGELEVFRDEDIAYATRLMQAGVPVELHVYPGAYHGWDVDRPDADIGRRAIADRLGALARGLA